MMFLAGNTGIIYSENILEIVFEFLNFFVKLFVEGCHIIEANSNWERTRVK